MRTGRAVLFTAALLALLPAAAAAADVQTDVPDKFKFAFGGMGASAYTDAGLSSTNAGIGATVNFEDIFDLPESKNVFRFEANWRMTKRQFLDFGFLELNRSGSRVLQQDVNWGDFVFKTGGFVTAKFNTNFPYAAWRYAFLDQQQVRISGSAGFVYLSMKAGLKADGTVDTTPPTTGEVDEEVSASVPVPQFGLQIDWILTKRMAVLMYLRQIYVKDIAGATGGIGETAIRWQWWYVKHAGVSLGLDKESIDLKRYDNGDTQAKFRYEVRGFSFYLNFAF